MLQPPRDAQPPLETSTASPSIRFEIADRDNRRTRRAERSGKESTCEMQHEKILRIVVDQSHRCFIKRNIRRGCGLKERSCVDHVEPSKSIIRTSRRTWRAKNRAGKQVAPDFDRIRHRRKASSGESSRAVQLRLFEQQDFRQVPDISRHKHGRKHKTKPGNRLKEPSHCRQQQPGKKTFAPRPDGCSHGDRDTEHLWSHAADKKRTKQRCEEQKDQARWNESVRHVGGQHPTESA